MVIVYLSLGSNVAREFHICAALDALAERFGTLRISSVYESEAVGFAGEAFYNLVVGLETDLGLASLVAFLKQLEDANGRDRSQPKFSARTLDIDVLLYGDQVGEVAGIRLPRAEITENAFVLRPLAEIAPDVLHPELKQTLGEMWRAYRSPQKLWPIDFSWAGKIISRGD